MANEEIKPEEKEQQPPAGGAEQNPPAPNPNPSDEAQKRIKDLEEEIKKRDAKLAEVQTEQATMEARRKEIEAQKLRESTDASTQARLKKIAEMSAIDPEGASLEWAGLLKEERERAAQEAAQKVLQSVEQKSAGEKFFSQIKSANPEFSDAIAKQTLALANEYAMSGKYKSPDDCINAATQFIKTELDSYANKKNATPKLPPGAGAESGGANTPPQTPPPPKELSALEELEAFNEAKARRFL